MTIAKFGRVSENQWAEAMGERAAEALPLADIPLPKRATAGSAGGAYLLFDGLSDEMRENKLIDDYDDQTDFDDLDDGEEEEETGEEAPEEK